jgi:uncharacterized membrane protein
MPFCASCGSQVEGRFCAKCGAVVGAGPATPPPPQPQPMGGSYPPLAPPPAVAGMADNAASALCYVLGLITGVLFLVIAPYNQNRTVRFHAFQSIFLSVAVIIISIVVGMVDAMLFTVTGFWLAFLIGRVFNLACILVWLYMIITTYQGKTTVLPVIGPIAQQQA